MSIATKTRRLANGFEVAYRSRANFDILQREMFGEDSLYDRKGIEIKPGDCIFDIGANIGFFVLYLEQKIKSGIVHAFEPLPETFSLLAANTQACTGLRIHLHNVGLAETPGTAVFRYFPRTNVASTMYPDRTAEFRRQSRKFILHELCGRGGPYKWFAQRLPELVWWPFTEGLRRYYQRGIDVVCRLRTLSEIIRERSVNQIDLLKIDAEGAEMDILRGIEPEHWALIRQAIIEVHTGEQGLSQVRKILSPHGFRVTTEPARADVSHLQMVYARRP